ncbi:MAG: 1,4-dihydroxy-6-naphthoate synthase [Planctomycetes bacterium]|nr:1,4-dihydroxy-6-naphthoate synthase [Planctomycetota bacterium]
MKLRVGISTCPNDTYAFHALLERRVHVDGVELDFVLSDVEELNQGLGEGRFDVAKASCHAALLHAQQYALLRSGAAIGYGVGPLLLAREAQRQPKRGDRVLCPGALTTATLLFRSLHPDLEAPEHCVFSAIQPALREGRADFGVVIHEGRFTYQDAGLHLVADLGELWEERTGAPLPLGGILVRKQLGAGLHRALHRALQASIDYAASHRDEALTSMRRYAQEHSDPVLWKHVELYVTEETRALSRSAELALRSLAEAAKAAGVISSFLSPLELAPVGA